jgi:DNA-binding transcriptional regulator GbsR (MarR family)
MGQITTILKFIMLVVGLLKDLLQWFKDSKIRKAERHVKMKDKAIRALNEKITEESKKEEFDDEIIKDLHRRINGISGKL